MVIGGIARIEAAILLRAGIGLFILQDLIRVYVKLDEYFVKFCFADTKCHIYGIYKSLSEDNT